MTDIRARIMIDPTQDHLDGLPNFKDYRIVKNLSGSAFDNFKYLATDDAWLSSPPMVKNCWNP